MADIFISYSHDDQEFVRRMVPALEAQGFSVWWDHTIPPGQTWDSFIARGIEDARVCVVVWSPNSVASDWVKEEATLAKDAGKLLPVSIQGVQPPVGFRRMQAADLSSWNGESSHAQWQLLLNAARSLVSTGPVSRSHAPRQSYTPAPAPKKPFPIAVIGAVAAAVVAGVLAFVLTRPALEATTAEVQTEVAATAEVPATTTPAESVATAPAQNEELERLRRERDQAVSAQREVQAREAAREREAVAERERVAAAAAAAPPSLLGIWNVDEGACGHNVWNLQSNGTFTGNGYTGRWRQSGASVEGNLETADGWRFEGTFADGRISGTITSSTRSSPCVLVMRRP